MQITAILGVYDEPPRLIKRTVESILKQTYKPFEFIITLDKPDNRAAKKYLESLTDKRIKLILNKKNKGHGLVKRKAIQMAKGAYIANLDVEHYYYPKKFDIQLREIKKQKADLLFTSYAGYDKSGKKHEVVFSKDEGFDTFFVRDCLSFSTALIKADVWKKHNYKKRIVPDDLPLFLKLHKKGFRFVVIPDVLIDRHTLPSYKSQKDYIMRDLRSNYRSLVLFIQYFSILWNKKNFLKVIIERIVYLGIFSIFLVLYHIGLFRFIWKYYLLKKWEE